MNKILTIFLIYLFPIQSIFSQNKFEAFSGTGAFELLYTGIHYNFNNKLQSGLKIGGLPLSGEKLFTLSGDFNYFYTGTSKFAEQPPWYLSGVITYSHDKIDEGGYPLQERNYQSIFLNFRHGRVLNFSQRLGLKIEMGIGIELMEYEQENNEKRTIRYINDKYSTNLIWPSGCIEVFFRI